jgi:hypothetical protein
MRCLILTNGLTVGANLSYDQAFETRVSADIKYRFGANGYGAPSIRKQQPVVMPVIQSLSTTPANRDVRVQDLEKKNQASAPNMIWSLSSSPFAR